MKITGRARRAAREGRGWGGKTRWVVEIARSNNSDDDIACDEDLIVLPVNQMNDPS